MGISYSIYVSTLWPMIPFVVKSQLVGSAYGILTSALNIGGALGSLMVGALTFNSKGEDAYKWVWMSLGIGCVLGSLFSICLLFSDRRYFNSILQKPSNAIFWDDVENLKLDDPKSKHKSKFSNKSKSSHYFKSNYITRSIRRSFL